MKMEFPGGNDNYLTITGPSHPFLSGAETFHTPSLGDEEFEIPPISLDSDPSLAVSDVVGHFDDLADPSSSQDGSFSAQYGVQTLDMPVGMTHGLMEQGGGLLSGGLTMVRGKRLSGLPQLTGMALGETKVTVFPTTLGYYLCVFLWLKAHQQRLSFT